MGGFQPSIKVDWYSRADLGRIPGYRIPDTGILDTSWNLDTRVPGYWVPAKIWIPGYRGAGYQLKSGYRDTWVLDIGWNLDTRVLGYWIPVPSPALELGRIPGYRVPGYWIPAEIPVPGTGYRYPAQVCSRGGVLLVIVYFMVEVGCKYLSFSLIDKQTVSASTVQHFMLQFLKYPHKLIHPHNFHLGWIWICVSTLIQIILAWIQLRVWSVVVMITRNY